MCVCVCVCVFAGRQITEPEVIMDIRLHKYVYTDTYMYTYPHAHNRYDAKVDVWAIGVILYTIICGCIRTYIDTYMHIPDMTLKWMYGPLE